MSDIRAIVVRAKEGDRQAFADLYDRFAPLVRALAYDATGSLAEAEDLCQEVFLQAYRNMDQLHQEERFPGWLMTIARRQCIGWGRTRRQRQEVELDSVELAEEAADPNRDEIHRMLEMIRELPDKERMALHQFYLAEQPAELARQTLGLSSAGFYKVLERAKRRLASLLQNRKVRR